MSTDHPKIFAVEERKPAIFEGGDTHDRTLLAYAPIQAEFPTVQVCAASHEKCPLHGHLLAARETFLEQQHGRV